MHWHAASRSGGELRFVCGQGDIGAPVLECHVEAGDLLYIPRGWIHQVRRRARLSRAPTPGGAERVVRRLAFALARPCPLALTAAFPLQAVATEGTHSLHVAPPPPLRTNRTRRVHPSVLTGHVYLTPGHGIVRVPQPVV